MMRALLLSCLLCASSWAQVRYDDILKGPGENWTTYAGSYQGWRYSPLKQITVENAEVTGAEVGVSRAQRARACGVRRSSIKA